MTFRFLTIDSPFGAQTAFKGSALWGINDNGVYTGFYYPTGSLYASSFTGIAGAFLYFDPGAS